MGWTPLFLRMDHQNVLIVGAGEVGERRAKRFLEAGADVIIIGENLSKDLGDLGASLKPPKDVQKWVEWSDLVVVASGEYELNERVACLAREKLINRADYPQKGNVIVPSSFFIGDVQMCIYTKGKSPLMARELRKKIQKVIKKEDILQLELQNHTRNILRDMVEDQKNRRSYLYQILNDKTIKKLLTEGKLEDAKLHVERFLKKS
jgi:precorrin-2 dehydrogenase